MSVEGMLDFGDTVDVFITVVETEERRKKICLCLSPKNNLFAFVNSNTYFGRELETITISSADLPRLRKKSYLDLSYIQYFADKDISAGLNSKSKLSEQWYQIVNSKIQSSRLVSKKYKEQINACYEEYVSKNK